VDPTRKTKSEEILSEKANGGEGEGVPTAERSKLKWGTNRHQLDFTYDKKERKSGEGGHPKKAKKGKGGAKSQVLITGGDNEKDLERNSLSSQGGAEPKMAGEGRHWHDSSTKVKALNDRKVKQKSSEKRLQVREQCTKTTIGKKTSRHRDHPFTKDELGNLTKPGKEESKQVGPKKKSRKNASDMGDGSQRATRGDEKTGENRGKTLIIECEKSSVGSLGLHQLTEGTK